MKVPSPAPPGANEGTSPMFRAVALLETVSLVNAALMAVIIATVTLSQLK